MGYFAGGLCCARPVHDVQRLALCSRTIQLDSNCQLLLCTLSFAFHKHVSPIYFMCLPFQQVVFVQSLGVSTLSYTVIVETMPENLKEVGVALTNAVLSTSSFIVLKFMPTLSAALGFYSSMFLFGVVSIPCGLFIIFYVPETKGKSYQEIMKSLS